MKYVHLPYGPVPQNFDLLFGTMSATHVAHIEVEYEGGYENHELFRNVSSQKCSVRKRIGGIGKEYIINLKIMVLLKSLIILIMKRGTL